MKLSKPIFRRTLALFLSVVMVSGMLLTGYADSKCLAANTTNTRTATPPSEAPENAVLVEGESGTFGADAGAGTDHAYSGSGFGIIGGADRSSISYTVNVTTAGTYVFAFNYIAGPVNGWADSRSINLYANGAKSAATFPGTSSWDNWSYFSQSIDLKAGDNTVKLEANGANDGICVDYFYYWQKSPTGTITSIKFDVTPINMEVGDSFQAIVKAVYTDGQIYRLLSGVTYSSDDKSVAAVDASSGKITGEKPGTTAINAKYSSFESSVNVTISEKGEMPITPHPNATVYQAENAGLSGGAVKDQGHTGYSGTGFVSGFGNSNTSVSFDVTVPSAGDYFISLRYAAGKVGGWPDDRTVGLSVNGGNAKEIIFKGTDSSWNTWSENIQKVTLRSGANTIAYKGLKDDHSDCINLDKLSVWSYSANPVVDAITFNLAEYSVSAGSTTPTKVYAVNTNGIQSANTSPVTYNVSDPSVATVDVSTGAVTGIKAGTTKITAQSNGLIATAAVAVKENPTVTVNFASVNRTVDPATFGYILTPNYTVPDSRLTLLGQLLNRETLPVQTFQAIGDLDSSYYAYEGSVMQRSLEAYKRVKATRSKWYMLLGMNPSWATASGGPMDSLTNANKKTPEQLARFKQYIKDILQYYKDNGAKPDFADLTNEYWTGTEPTYKGNWEALREVYPDFIPAVGPGGVGFDGIPDFYLPYASKNNITMEGPSWHAYWTSNTYATYSTLQGWKDTVANYQAKYPEANGKYIIWEENNAGSTNATDWTRSMANVIRSGVTQNIKGCMEASNANGMSDLITANDRNSQNPAARRQIWWVYYAFGQMSGQYVNVSTDYTEDFTAAACKDANESKIIFAKDGTPGSVNIKLNHQPYSGQNIKIDLYKITSAENNGLEYQGSIDPPSLSTDNMDFTVKNVGANETWMAVVKKAGSSPSFFCPMTPDDGEATTTTPILTWSAAQGAISYTVKVAANKDLSHPVITKSGITDTNYRIDAPLTAGQKYYWSVTAVNQCGSTPAAHNTVYSFIAETSTDVPGQFSPYLPSVKATNESVTPEFQWSTAYGASSYRLVVSKNSDLSNPVIDQTDITNVRDTGEFGPNSQAYYQPTSPLDYDTTYFWAVYAANSHGERPMNGPLHVFTTKAKGDSPTSFSLTAPTNNAEKISARAILSWEASKNAFFYKLEVSKNKDMSNPVILRDRMIYNKYTVEPNLLEPSTTYYWRVTAYTKDLKYSASDTEGIRSFTTEAVPCSPLLYAEYGSGDKVKLWFQTSDGATSYKIKYGAKSGNYTKTISNVRSSPYEVQGLSNGTYYFAVEAVNEGGNSSIWNERSVTLSASSSVTVPVTGVALDTNLLSLALGNSRQLTVTVFPSDSTDKKVVWTSSDCNVATVDSTGKVTTVAVGTATITATAEDGGSSASCALTVTPVTHVSPGSSGTSSPPATPIIVPAPGNSTESSTGLGTVFFSDTVAPLSVNDAYTFKITSKDGKVPTFVIGTAGVFSVNLVKTDGNDYYYKITATGKPGSSAGIYVDGGQRLLVATVKSNAYYASDTISDLAVNSCYTFKITSKDGKVPTFVIGTAGVFSVKLVKTNGNDYYYKITATGKSGSSVGIYIDDCPRLLVATVK